jgi:putative membrane protein
MDWMGGWMVLWGVFALALLVLVILGIVWLVRSLTDRSPRSIAPAEDELRRRYATGELSRDEFLRRMADIRGP